MKDWKYSLEVAYNIALSIDIFFFTWQSDDQQMSSTYSHALRSLSCSCSSVSAGSFRSTPSTTAFLKEKAELAVAIEHQRLVERTSETERQKALIEAQRVADVEAIGMQTKIAAQEAERKISAISNTMLVEKAAASADAEFTRLRAIASLMNCSEGRAALQHHLAEGYVTQTRDAMRHARMIVVPDTPNNGVQSITSALALAAFTQQAVAH